MLSLKYLQIIQNPVHCWLNPKWSTFTEVFPQLISSSTSVFTSLDPPSNNTLEIKSDTQHMKSHCYLHITVQIHGVNPATYRTQHFPCVPTALRQPSTKLVAGPVKRTSNHGVYIKHRWLWKVTFPLLFLTYKHLSSVFPSLHECLESFMATVPSPGAAPAASHFSHPSLRISFSFQHPALCHLFTTLLPQHSSWSS